MKIIVLLICSMMRFKYIKVLISVILLLLIVFVTLIPKERYIENFESLTVEDAYRTLKNSTDFDNYVYDIYPSISKTSIMVFKRCYNFQNKRLEDIVGEGSAYNKTFGIYANNFETVENRIIQELDSFSSMKGKINGDVYILISQAPYYRDEGKVISNIPSTTNSNGYLFEPIFSNQVVSNRPIYYQIIMYYASYKSNGTYSPCSDLFYSSIQRLDASSYSKQPQCFIGCLGKTDKYCGCGTTNENTTAKTVVDAKKQYSQKHYSAMCLDNPLNTNGTPNLTVPATVPTTFITLYVVNPKANVIDKFFNQDDKCRLVNNKINSNIKMNFS